MTVSIFSVNTFTNEPFKGNPAAVCILTTPASPRWMRYIAREVNLPVTAFVQGEKDEYRLRCFTPRRELETSVHAALAAAHVLWREGMADTESALGFVSEEGRLSASLARDWIELNAPAAKLEPGDLGDACLNSLHVHPVAIFRSDEKVLLELENEAEVARVKPNYGELRKLSENGIILTARSDAQGVDFVLRYFDPRHGVNEDPATASVQFLLGPYWRDKLAKDHLLAHQLSKRGGTIRVRMSGERVYVSGQAVTVSRGEILIPFEEEKG